MPLTFGESYAESMWQYQDSVSIMRWDFAVDLGIFYDDGSG